MNEGSTGVVVNLTVDDRDDPATGAWRAIYSIINGDPNQNFEIQTNLDNNEGMLSVVKVHNVQLPDCLVMVKSHEDPLMGLEPIKFWLPVEILTTYTKDLIIV